MGKNKCQNKRKKGQEKVQGLIPWYGYVCNHGRTPLLMEIIP